MFNHWKTYSKRPLGYPFKESSGGFKGREEEKEGVETVADSKKGKVIEVYTICQWCKANIWDFKSSGFVEGIGNLHSYCVPNAIRARCEDREDARLAENTPLKKENVKILFVDNASRNIDLWERLRDSREDFPEIDYDVNFKDVKNGAEELKKGTSFDFIFLDAPRSAQLRDHVDLILKMPPQNFPREVVFYGRWGVVEKKELDGFCTELQLAGISARILLLREMVFSKFRETRSPVVVEPEGSLELEHLG